MITLLVSLALQAHAAPVAQSVGQSSDEFVKVTSMVQFVEGHAQKTEASGMKSDLLYQSPVYEGDRVETNGVLKVATRSNCIFVLRGDGTLAAPSGSKPWRMRAESLRLICSGRTTAETFGIENQPLVMTNGEVLVSGKNILLLNGTASYSGKPLPLHKLVSMDVSEVSPQPSENDLRDLNLAQKPPREAYVWPVPAEAPKPDRIYSTRVMFGPVGGTSAVAYDNNADYGEGNLRGEGPRLQVHFKTKKDAAFIVALTYRDLEKKDYNYQAESVHNQLKTSLLEVGYRNSYDRWWSPYWRIGGGVVNAKIFTNKQNGIMQSSTGYTYEFYSLSAVYGIDAHLTPHFLRPFGFFAGLEGQLIQSLWRGGRIREFNYNNPNAPPEPNEPWRMTSIGAVVQAGVEFQF